ncbi:hypothetical protein RRG08_038722 [Elysia crispata]|uniref:Uncharacterized protein n=1 Tax=Elysia crispata TaxID=231223 RepID=A0AAE0ZJS2_9GAST|nr:hypothetical protein RRG08_038722 [Elysia crispata]
MQMASKWNECQSFLANSIKISISAGAEPRACRQGLGENCLQTDTAKSRFRDRKSGYFRAVDAVFRTWSSLTCQTLQACAARLENKGLLAARCISCLILPAASSTGLGYSLVRLFVMMVQWLGSSSRHVRLSQSQLSVPDCFIHCSEPRAAQLYSD